MPELVHLLLTRYNLAVPGRTENLDETWLANRLELFREYCVPSVRGQDGDSFRWIVLMDRHTPAGAMADVEAVLGGIADIVTLDEPLDDTPIDAVLDRIGVPAHVPLLTSRLDSDDCIGRSYIRTVRTAAEARAVDPSTSTAFNFPFGLQMRGDEVYGLIDMDNPFMSLLEPPHSRRTVLAVSHRELKTISTLKQLPASPKWLQIVHDTNIDNDIRGIRLARSRLQRDFGFLHDGSSNCEFGAEVFVSTVKSTAAVIGHLGRKVRRKVLTR